MASGSSSSGGSNEEVYVEDVSLGHNGIFHAKRTGVYVCTNQPRANARGGGLRALVASKTAFEVFCGGGDGQRLQKLLKMQSHSKRCNYVDVGSNMPGVDTSRRCGICTAWGRLSKSVKQHVAAAANANANAALREQLLVQQQQRPAEESKGRRRLRQGGKPVRKKRKRKETQAPAPKRPEALSDRSLQFQVQPLLRQRGGQPPPIFARPPWLGLLWRDKSAPRPKVYKELLNGLPETFTVKQVYEHCQPTYLKLFGRGGKHVRAGLRLKLQEMHFFGYIRRQQIGVYKKNGYPS